MMSRYKEADFGKVRLYNLAERKSKIRAEDFARLKDKVEIIDIESLHHLAEKIIEACKNKRKVIFMMGAHPIKCGLSLYLIDLINRGIITHIAMNGAAAIHDFEIALAGQTSEYVEENLSEGKFGMWKETGIINMIINESESLGFGEALGRYISTEGLRFKEYSILANAYEKGIPATVHITIGADIIHVHPNFDGAKTGEAAGRDLRIFAESVAKAENGVVVNIGSAVVMPEVFLKARSYAINTGHNGEITTADIDMVDHYRTEVNVLKRQGEEWIKVRGRHEKTIPSLYKLIIEGMR